MKEINDCLGLPLIALDNSEEVGIVSHFLTDPVAGTVVGLGAASKQPFSPPLALLFGDVVAFGLNALMIRAASAVRPIASVSELQPFLDCGDEKRVRKAVSLDGTNLGLLVDWAFDEVTAEVVLYRLERPDGAAEWIPHSSFEVSGKAVVILNVRGSTPTGTDGNGRGGTSTHSSDLQSATHGVSPGGAARAASGPALGSAAGPAREIASGVSAVRPASTTPPVPPPPASGSVSPSIRPDMTSTAPSQPAPRATPVPAAAGSRPPVETSDPLRPLSESADARPVEPPSVPAGTNPTAVPSVQRATTDLETGPIEESAAEPARDAQASTVLAQESRPAWTETQGPSAITNGPVSARTTPPPADSGPVSSRLEAVTADPKSDPAGPTEPAQTSQAGPLAGESSQTSDPSSVGKEDRPVADQLKDAINRNQDLMIPLVVDKYADRDISDDHGTVIVTRGQLITSEIADRARGAWKLYDLWIAAQALPPDRT